MNYTEENILELLEKEKWAVFVEVVGKRDPILRDYLEAQSLEDLIELSNVYDRIHLRNSEGLYIEQRWIGACPRTDPGKYTLELKIVDQIFVFDVEFGADSEYEVGPWREIFSYTPDEFKSLLKESAEMSDSYSGNTPGQIIRDINHPDWKNSIAEVAEKHFDVIAHLNNGDTAKVYFSEASKFYPEQKIELIFETSRQYFKLTGFYEVDEPHTWLDLTEVQKTVKTIVVTTYEDKN